jgi:hypothetical protein
MLTTIEVNDKLNISFFSGTICIASLCANPLAGSLGQVKLDYD